MRGCSGDEGEPRWKLFELKLRRRRFSTSHVFFNALVHFACYLKKEEDCALGSWTMLLLTTLPSVRLGPVGEAAFWEEENDLEMKTE